MGSASSIFVRSEFKCFKRGKINVNGKPRIRRPNEFKSDELQVVLLYKDWIKYYLEKLADTLGVKASISAVKANWENSVEW